jgi:prepilin-type N-terminal cleavage/methylation domain-containing protein/prepilin-type processing-associated H-X9-DG protein
MIAQMYRRKAGFTAIELLVVIVIFLILLSIFIPYALHLRETSRRTQCASNLRQLRDALHLYASADVSHIYPRVTAQEGAGYAAFTAADDPNPFGPESNVAPNDVTASLWLLVRNDLVKDLNVFICPSASDAKDPLVDPNANPTLAVKRSNFRLSRHLSYSYASPFSDAPGYRLDDARVHDFAVMADKSPGVSGVGDNILGPIAGAPADQLAAANSNNHSKAGQNVLFADGSVAFEPTPYCGAGRAQGPGDNIYTAASEHPLPQGSAPPLISAIGFWSHSIGPAWESDSYLLPTDDDTPASFATTKAAPATKTSPATATAPVAATSPTTQATQPASNPSH